MVHQEEQATMKTFRIALCFVHLCFIVSLLFPIHCQAQEDNDEDYVDEVAVLVATYTPPPYWAEFPEIVELIDTSVPAV